MKVIRRHDRPGGARAARTRRAFSLVELLTVIFIIGLLISILIPSLNSARNAAKKLVTSKALEAIRVGLEMFKNDNGTEFPQTNGYPPSFVHPPISGYAFDASKGQFPFVQDKPVAYGAQWLPFALMGLDFNGYVKRSAVPARTPPLEPTEWYKADPLNQGRSLERCPLYVDPGGLRTLKTKDIPGRRPEEKLEELFPNWDKVQNLPVIVDAWDQPILYYVANTNGKATNMVAKDHTANDYPSSNPSQERGQPYYYHQDNIGFTGPAPREDQGKEINLGWSFSNTTVPHAIAKDGATITAVDLRENDPKKKDNFARYIVDRKVYAQLQVQDPPPTADAPLRPVNADSYLLISAGVDGLYGTKDDVSNLPPFTE